MMRRILPIGLILLLTAVQSLSADPVTLTVDVAHPGAKISPTLYGLMTEEINHSYDGGLYAELIQNRIFKDNPDAASHWSVIKDGGADARITLDQKDPVNTTALTNSLRLDVITPGQRAGIANDGYWGIPVWPNTKYTASFYAKATPEMSSPLTIDIENKTTKAVLAQATIPAITTAWKKYEVTLTTGDVTTTADTRFVISTNSPGSVWFSLVSLFPPTYKNRPNGNRIDLMQKLADMHPSFLRMPGGNYLEGDTIDERFIWQNTLGPLEDRPGHQGPWSYRSSDGLGLAEFFGWCEDLNIQPVLAVFAGYSLRGAHIDAGPELTPFVQEALDEIEYSIGDQSTKWGQARAKAGHPQPYNVKYIEIGNEDWFDRSNSYDARFAQFYDAIKAKYPQLQLIATTPVESRKPDVIDDHFYRSARSMEADIHHYDKLPRSGPKIFVGEWATEEGTPTPDLNSAVADAAWLTGLERNSDLVVMSCYAPLMVDVNPGGWQWPTNLIGFNATTSFASPSYYAQKMFNENRGDIVLPTHIDQKPTDASLAPVPHGAVGIGTWQTTAEFKDLTVTNGNNALYHPDFSKDPTDWRLGAGTWQAQDGISRQTSDERNCTATIGDTSWTDYTFNIKARKIGGAEGFLILFHCQGPDTYFWWNIGGWGNSRTGLERVTDGAKEPFGDSSPVTIETGKWYDIRVELKGHTMKCYLDNKLLNEATESIVYPDAVIATASRDDSTGEIILKVVNTVPTPQTIQINLQGAQNIGNKATGQTLTGNPKDVNTIDAPEKIIPHPIDIDNAGSSFTHDFPGTSVTVLRLTTK